VGIPTLILVGGKPATGKTTIARRLASELRITCLSKDGFKEVLFDTLGWRDVAWSQTLGAASIELLYHVIEQHLATGQSLIAESNFDPMRTTRRLSELRGRVPFQVTQILCVADAATVLERYQARVDTGMRHPGHFDQERLGDLRDRVLREPNTPIDIEGTVIEVDTSDFTTFDLDALIRRVRDTLLATEIERL